VPVRIIDKVSDRRDANCELELIVLGPKKQRRLHLHASSDLLCQSSPVDIKKSIRVLVDRLQLISTPNRYEQQQHSS